jgi:ABC-type antimicrobial peptide transport system permease subunit
MSREAAAFVIAVAMISCAVPLRRALRIEFMQTVRANAEAGV